MWISHYRLQNDRKESTPHVIWTPNLSIFGFLRLFKITFKIFAPTTVAYTIFSYSKNGDVRVSIAFICKHFVYRQLYVRKWKKTELDKCASNVCGSIFVPIINQWRVWSCRYAGVFLSWSCTICVFIGIEKIMDILVLSEICETWKNTKYTGEYDHVDMQVFSCHDLLRCMFSKELKKLWQFLSCPRYARYFEKY